MGRVVHFEIPADDPARSLAFYDKAFGWKSHQWGDQSYWIVPADTEGQPGIGGGIMPRGGAATAVVCVIGVDDIDEAAKKVHAAGGSIVVPKQAIPTIGWFFYFKDTEGNVLGAMQEDAGAA